jgi:hypothetical protein
LPRIKENGISGLPLKFQFSSWLRFIIGLAALGTLGAGATLKRQLKPSQSSEKETTKVG